MLAEGARQVESGDITDAAVSDATKYADCWHARRMAIGENAAYAEVAELPALVRAAVLLAQGRNFDHSCRPEQSRLLAVMPDGIATARYRPM